MSNNVSVSLGNTVSVLKNENLVIVSTPGPMGPAGADGAPGDDGGGGDVVGPSGAVSGNLPIFSGTTGKLLSDSGTSVDYLTNLILNREVTGVAATLVSNHAALASGVHGISNFAATLLDDANASAFITTLFGGATGTGNAVRSSSPTLVTPTLGVASATSLALTGDITGAVNGYITYGRFSGLVQIGGTTYFNVPADGFFTINDGGSSKAVSVGIEANHHLSIKSGSSAQSFSVYNVAGTDYERGVFDWQTTADTLTIGTQKGGAGSTRELQFVVGGGAARLRIDTSGNSFFQGAITVGANVSIADNFAFYWSSRSLIWSPSDGVVRFSNNANSDFDRLQFGGTTSSHPSLKRRTTALEARLADDSAITTLVGAMVLKAGAVSDADFTNPVDGCHGFDTTNFKHYVRVGGAWKSSAAYT